METGVPGDLGRYAPKNATVAKNVDSDNAIIQHPDMVARCVEGNISLMQIAI